MENNSDKTKKSTVEVDENDILKYAKKIEKNAVEDKAFSQKIDDFTKGKLKTNEVVKVGTTPYCLRIVGAEPVPLVVPQNVLANSLFALDKLSNQTKKRHSKQHNIPKEILETLPKMIRTPILIGKGSIDGTLVVVTEKKNTYGDPIIVPITLSANFGKTNVNKVATIYGKEGIKNYLETMITSHKLLAINEEKAVRLYEDTGVQFPQSLTAIRFDNSIAYSMKNVKDKRRDFTMSNKKDVINKNYEQANESLNRELPQKEEISPETLELLNSTFYFPKSEQISNYISAEKIESLSAEEKKSLNEEISALWSKVWHELPDLTEEPGDLWTLEKLPDELHNDLMGIYERANESLNRELPQKEEASLNGDTQKQKEKPEKQKEQKTFTFSRKQLNDSAKAIKEQPHKSERGKDKDKNHNMDI